MFRPRPISADRESERRFWRIATLAPVGIFETDAEGNCLFVNAKFCQLAGMSPEQTTGHGWAKTVHPEDRDRILREWYEGLREGQEFTAECRFLVGGQVRWLQGTARGVRNESGRIDGYIGTLTSIDERKQVESALRTAEARLDAVLTSIGDFLITFDHEWRITYVNAAAEKLLGFSGDELLGRSIWEVFPDAVGKETYHEFHEAVDEQRVVRAEHYYSNLDVWVENYVYPSPSGVTVFASDVTWRKRLENELLQRNESLAEADRRKDEFLALLAHELRNPLAPVRSALEVMRMPAAGASAVARMRDIAERQLEHMSRLLDDLLDVSRIGRGNVELQLDTVDVGATIRRTVDALRPSIEGKRQSLSVWLPAHTLLVQADTLRLEQILTNLLSNAVKYTPDGGRIAIDGRSRDGTIEIRIRDSGRGIPPGLLPKVFDLFVRIEAPQQEGSHRGMGVGLALVKKLVELHGGRVEARSEGTGKGSEFVVYLPASAAPRGVTDMQRRDEPTDITRGMRVLVVDDNRDAADSLSLLLGVAGYEASTAYSGHEALALAREQRPDAILLDLGMPDVDGYEVARAIRSDPSTKGATLIALTGWGQDEDRRRSAEAGFDHHLTKPVAFDAVQRLFADVVKKQ